MLFERYVNYYGLSRDQIANEKKSNLDCISNISNLTLNYGWLSIKSIRITSTKTVITAFHTVRKNQFHS